MLKFYFLKGANGFLDTLYIIPRATVCNTATCLGICRVRIFKAYHYGDNSNFQLALRLCLLF